MPELPEVETIVRELREQILTRRIMKAEILRTDVLKNCRSKSKDFARFFLNRTFHRVERHGKFILFSLDNQSKLLAHLGMTGKFVTAETGDPQPRWLCSQYHFHDGLRLDHVDVRRLGRLEIYSPDVEIPVLKRLGIDPLSSEFGSESCQLLIKNRTGRKRRSRAIHTLLLDQSLISGVGNIYAAEALFRAGIRPTRAAGKITQTELARLTISLRQVLKESLRWGGTTVSDYRRVDEKQGRFQQKLRVYGRDGDPCRKCGTEIKRVVLGGRSAYYCGKCQK